MSARSINRKLVWTLLALVTVLLGLTLMVLVHHIWSFETALFFAINDWPDWLAGPMRIITEFGSVWVILLLISVLGLVGQLRLVSRLVLAGIFGFVIVQAIKTLVARPRPFVLLDGVHQRVAESGFGFPSGHTTLAAALSVTIALTLGGYWKWLPLLWITLVGLSRIYVGVHLPFDIIGGVCVGAGAAIVVHLAESVRGQKARAFWLEIQRKAR